MINELVGLKDTLPLEALGALTKVVSKLHSLRTHFLPPALQESCRGHPYKGTVVVEAMVMTGMLRDNADLKDCLLRSMRVAFPSEEVADAYVRRLQALALPSASTLSRWAFSMEVAQMVL